MSSYSFSQQFYQHWTGAPELVRAAIVQELTDITSLLQTQAPFEKFVFSIHDLDAHLDDLYCIHEIQQAVEKEQAAKKIEASRIKAEEEQRQQEEEDRTKEAQLKAEADAIADAQNDTDTEKSISIENENKKDSLTQDDKSTPSTNPVKAILNDSNKEQAIELGLKNSELNAEHKGMLTELEVHIDDYLTEQMLQMSENLKSWLRAEISQQLAKKDKMDDVKKDS